jgi:hypothetical protein
MRDDREQSGAMPAESPGHKKASKTGKRFYGEEVLGIWTI